MDTDRLAELYTDLCDVVERAWMHLPVARDDAEPRNTSAYAREAANRILELVGSYGTVATTADLDYDDQVYEERDEAVEAADELTEVIEDITGVVAGEHSNMNEPWKNAVLAGAEYVQGSDFEYGVRTIDSATMHRDRMSEAEARAFLDPADWDGMPRPVEEVFEVVRRRRGPWHVAPLQGKDVP